MTPRKQRRQAVALRYALAEDRVPRLVAKGTDNVADRILALAKQHNVPVRQDRDLVAVLAKLEVDREIPPALYKAVAEILAFVYRMSNAGMPPAPVADQKR